jgi:hypothetical protein
MEMEDCNEESKEAPVNSSSDSEPPAEFPYKLFHFDAPPSNSESLDLPDDLASDNDLGESPQMMRERLQEFRYVVKRHLIFIRLIFSIFLIGKSY